MLEHRDCAAIDEMLPAYAVDGLDAADRALVDEHLATCERHEDAAAWGDVALRLADLAPEMTPSAGLRDRILAIPAAPPVMVVETTSAPTPVRVPSAPVEDSDAVRQPTPIRTSRLPYALAAAFAAIAVFFGAWTGILLTGGDADGEPRMVASTSEGGIEATATFIEDEQVALVRFSGLTPLSEDRDYQLWAIGPGESPSPAGIVNVQGGSIVASVPGSFEDGWTFAITIEPAGGSPAPTSDPIIAVTF